MEEWNLRTLTNNELQLMTNIVGVDQKSLQRVLYKFLKQHYDNVAYDESFLVAIGDIPIALVAHMDTVFSQPACEVYYDRVKNVMWSPTGMGADDRAGVFSILQIIKSGLRPHIIFTTDEEIGCVGAGVLADLPCPFKDLRYIIQLDRRNSNDCVFYGCNNEEFEKYIESFGFVTAFGSFSDICELCPSWEVAGVNLSVGYRDEHTTSEVLFVGQMFATIEKVKRMLTAKDIPAFDYIPALFYGYNWDYLPSSYYGPYPKEEDELYSDIDVFSGKEAKYKCCKCKKNLPYKDILEIKLKKGGSGYCCHTCAAAGGVEWCLFCGEPFEIDPKKPDEAYCPTCRKRLSKYDRDKFTGNQKAN